MPVVPTELMKLIATLPAEFIALAVVPVIVTVCGAPVWWLFIAGGVIVLYVLRTIIEILQHPTTGGE